MPDLRESNVKNPDSKVSNSKVSDVKGSVYEEPVPDSLAETAVVQILSDIFGSVSHMDPETVHDNILKACEGGMSEDDRSIRMELANYIMSHFSLIFTGLIVNPEFRETFMEAVSVEIALEGKEESFVQEIRASMRDETPRESRGNFVINLCRYNDKIYRKINEKVAEGFEKIDGYSSAINDFAERLTEDDMIDIGYCASNFMYAFRAFSKNSLFTNYVKAVVKVVQEQLGIDLKGM